MKTAAGGLSAGERRERVPTQSVNAQHRDLDTVALTAASASVSRGFTCFWLTPNGIYNAFRTPTKLNANLASVQSHLN